ncbi:hypothetical protein FNV43_RR05764 [Rhamnella rubrinervis]|uniref:Uncharacterized protein n=1 Tax=Rhamnella rubrinervis TaxID=2594499 RepID=A0A8K0MQR0_9ROSA|nr:hypothetical protein FNV43_RR05764 [Rhamnella rubrinervis]
MKSTKVSKAFKYPATTDAQFRIISKEALGKVLIDVKKRMSTLMKNVDEITPEYLVRQQNKMDESCFVLKIAFGFSMESPRDILKMEAVT